MSRELYDKRNLALDAEACVRPALRARQSSPTGKEVKMLKGVVRAWEALRAWRRAQKSKCVAGRRATGRLVAHFR